MTAIYVHIPYCIKKCRYCDFCSVSLDETASIYCDALIKEITLRKKQYPDLHADTVFFGGGTPTVLPAADLVRVLESVNHAFPLAPNAEISVECNPKTASNEELRILRQGGVNRISIGLQSADDQLLKRIGRVHSFQDFQNTYNWSIQVGFSNVNVDVMHGLPGQSAEQYLQTLQIVTELHPHHISAYSLILEEETPLFYDVASGIETLPDEDQVADMQDMGIDYLSSVGYKRYEVSNFAIPGYECRHNLTYWNNETYLGLGVAAHSCMEERGKRYRFANTESIKSYLKAVERGKLPEAEKILINTFEQMFETIMLGLRKTQGIDLKMFEDCYGCSLLETYPAAIERNQTRGLWDHTDPRYLRLNRRGMDLMNTVLLDFKDTNYFELLRP